MAKSISANLTTHINSDVTTLAVCVEITRTDYSVVRITNHDTDITVNSEVYDHTIPFVASASGSSSTLSVDNTELTLFIDGTTFVLEDFHRGLYKHADVRIFMVDYTTPADGIMLVREGWAGQAVINEQNVVKMTVVGLLKILDFEVGRTYQPMCDADLGDKRCKVAMDFGQAWSELNPYTVGDWVYAHDLTTMTDVSSLSNPGFESDGVVANSDPITGWTDITVDSATPIWAVNTTFDSAVPLAGTYMLKGNTATGNSSDEVQGLYQEVGLVAGGMNTTDIDAGDNFIYFSVGVMHPTAIQDRYNVVLIMLDANGEILRKEDSGLRLLSDELDPDVAVDEWREEIFCFPVPPLTRTARIELYAAKDVGTFYNVCFDRVRLKFWDHTAVTPYTDAIHKMVRVVVYDDTTEFSAANGSFETQSAEVANTNSTAAITSWVIPTANDYWRIVRESTADIASTVPDGTYMLFGGDDSSGTQSTYEITQLVDLAALGLDTARIDLGKIVMKFEWVTIHEEATSDAQVDLDFQDSVFSTVNALSDPFYSAGPLVNQTRTLQQTVAATTRHLEIKFSVRTPVGDSKAEIGFDRIRMWFFDAEVASDSDPVEAQGTTATTFSTTADTYTADGDLLWKAKTVNVEFDTVSAVDGTDGQKFTGTNIAGASGAFELSEILWLSGDNAGQKNIIRTWTTGTQEIRVYFQPISAVQVGDTFTYTFPCHKRFDEDCITNFDNAINFRGFPHLPGKLTAS